MTKDDENNGLPEIPHRFRSRKEEMAERAQRKAELDAEEAELAASRAGFGGMVRNVLGGIRGAFENIPSRFRVPVVVGILSLAGVTGAIQCSVIRTIFRNEDAVNIQKDPVLLSRTESAWKFDMYRTGQTQVTDQYGSTLYHFINGTLTSNNIFPKGWSDKDKLNLIDGIIYFCRILNPQETLDTFSSIKDRTIYFPEALLATGANGAPFILDLGFGHTPEKDVEIIELKSKQGGEILPEQKMSELNKVLSYIAAAHGQHDTPEITRPKLSNFDALMVRAKVDSYHTIFMDFNTLSRDDLKKHGNKTATQIQDEIDGLLGDQNKNASRISELTRIRNAMMYYELIDIVTKMTPDEVERARVLQGTVLDAPRKEGFYNLNQIWEYKKTKKGKGEDRSTFDSIQRDLSGKDHQVPMSTWLATQEQACAYFQAHGAELGYNADMTKYITPALVAAVINAEFFSEFKGRAYLDLLPIALESGNLVYGPAVNDDEVSAGVVQMIKSTFGEIMNSKGQTLSAIQAKDPSFQIKVPSMHMRTGRGGRLISVFDSNEAMAEAMVTDLNSQLFYATLAIAFHIGPGFNTLMNDPQFNGSWKHATEAEQAQFLGSFAAMSINMGQGGTNKAAMRMLVIQSPNLGDYIQGIHDHTAGNKQRGADVGLSTMRTLQSMAGELGQQLAATPPLLQQPQPVPTTASVSTPQVSNEIQSPSRSITKTNLTPKQKNGRSTYVLTIPRWKLDQLATALLEDPSRMNDVKKFNHAKKIEPGQAMDFPIDMLRPELRGGALTAIGVNSPQDADTLLSRILKPQYNTKAHKDAILVVSNEGTWRTWDDVSGPIKVPTSWIIDENAINSPTISTSEYPATLDMRIKRQPRPERYNDLVARAIANGYPLDDTQAHQRIYEAALHSPTAVNMMTQPQSVYFFRAPSTDSESIMEKDAFEVFSQLAIDFYAFTGGYKLSFGNVLRSPEKQAQINVKEDQKVRGTTHLTGRTTDIPDGRFIDPQGREITWSQWDVNGNPSRGPNADIIEKELRPVLDTLMAWYQDKGEIMPYRESDHYHILIPRQ